MLSRQQGEMMPLQMADSTQKGAISKTAYPLLSAPAICWPITVGILFFLIPFIRSYHLRYN